MAVSLQSARKLTGQEYRVRAGEGGGIDQQPVAAHFGGETCQGLIAHGVCHPLNFGILIQRVHIHLADTAAGDDVVELVETDQPPGLGEGFAGVGVVGVEVAGEAGQEFGVVQGELGLAVGAFAAALGGVGAAVVLQVQLAVPGGQVGAAGCFQVAEEVAGGALAGLRQAGEARHRTQVFEHFAGRAAAAVAVAKGHEDVLLDFLLLEVLPGIQGGLRVGRGVVGAGSDGGAAVLRRGAEMGQHARAVQPLPPERVVRHAVVLVPAQLDGEKVVQPGLFDELRQRPGIAEDIRQPQHRRLPRLRRSARGSSCARARTGGRAIPRRSGCSRPPPTSRRWVPSGLRPRAHEWRRTAPGDPGG